VIAIVDDDEFVLDSAKDLIESLGYDAMAFSSAEEFLQWKCSHEASCLITDMQMPGLSGLDLQERLISQGANVPVIVVSAFFNEATQARAMRAGALVCIEKPYREESLIKYLEIATKGQGNGSRAP
jgi:FixJ family two-component response regulator